MRPRWLSVYLLYLLLAVLITWPLAWQLDTHLAGYSNTDSTERVHHVWWLSHALRTGQTLFWLPNLGWPDGMAGISLLARPFNYWPASLLALALPLLVADNLLLLSQTALMGLGMYALGLRLGGGSRAAALIGGLVFMAAPTFQAHLGNGHSGHHALAFAPLFVLALLRLRETEGRKRQRWFVAGALCFMLPGSGHVLQVIYVMLPLTLLLALRELWRRDWRGLGQLLLVCLAGALLQMFFILPVFSTTLDTPAYTGAGGDVHFSLDLLGVITPSFHHPLYGQLGFTWEVLGSYIGERSAWIGLVAGALALLALVRGRGRFWLGLALLAWLLALGPLLNLLGESVTVRVDDHTSYVTLPSVILQGVPLLQLSRTPGRFSYALALAIACLATQGAALLFGQPRFRSRLRQALLLTLLLVAILFDYQWFWPFPTLNATIPVEIVALGQRDDLRAVLNIPVRRSPAVKNALWLQTAHQLPLIGGQVTRSSPVNPARLALLEQTLDPALLLHAGADIVIVHRRYAWQHLLSQAEAQLGPAIYQDEIYAVYETPATEAAPPLHAPLESSLRFTTPLDVPLYVPQDGWLDVSAEMRAGGRDLLLLLDNYPWQRWTWYPQKVAMKHASLPLRADAWHMLTYVPEPACLQALASGLVCPEEALERFTLEFVPATMRQARFAEGVTLLAGSLPARVAAGDEMVLRLHWDFAQGRDDFDVRFVHLLDAEGQLVAQSDETPGLLPAGSQRSERIVLALPQDLLPGEYRAWLGWYRYPQITRLPLLEPADAQGDVLPLGVVRID